MEQGQVNLYICFMAFRLFTILTLIILIGSKVSAQSKRIKLATDTARILVENISLNSFPKVKIEFKAVSDAGVPFWQLGKKNINIFESGIEQIVDSLVPLTKRQPINLALVIDHSGSMMAETVTDMFIANYYGLYNINTAPISKAKNAAKIFLKNSVNFSKDSVIIIGFSSFVDAQSPFFTDVVSAQKFIDSLQPDGSTAFYDAIDVAVESLSKKSGVKAIIALTDGDDNSSSQNITTVLKKAATSKIPVYTIGLGIVEKRTLKKIASQTGGVFKYANKASALDKIYQEMDKQIKARYAVYYTSGNLKSSDNNRLISMNLVGQDTNNFVYANYKSTVALPDTVVKQLKSVELKQEVTQYSLYSAGMLFGVGLPVFLLYRRRKKKQETIEETA